MSEEIVIHSNEDGVIQRMSQGFIKSMLDLGIDPKTFCVALENTSHLIQHVEGFKITVTSVYSCAKDENEVIH